jgi:transcriptional regulator with XRE-family HTH domain
MRVPDSTCVDGRPRHCDLLGRWSAGRGRPPQAAALRASLEESEERCSELRIVQAHEPQVSLLSDSVTGTRQDWQEIDNRPDRRVRVEAPTASPESPLRLARRHRNWTLERVVSEIDSHLGGSGVTASLLSAWERGTRRTSPRYRAALCAIYGQPPETLFAHQDHGRPTLALVDADLGLINPAQVVCGFEQLQAAMVRVVGSARASLAIVGSRSRDRAYLATIVEVLRMQSRLVHWRVLVGPPHRQVLKDHLIRLLDLRDPADRTYGMQTLHLGMVEDQIREPERFFVASESQAVVTIPSMTAASNFDTGILLAHPLQARALVEHAKQLYAGSRKLETLAAVEALPVLR